MARAREKKSITRLGARSQDSNQCLSTLPLLLGSVLSVIGQVESGGGQGEESG